MSRCLKLVKCGCRHLPHLHLCRHAHADTRKLKFNFKNKVVLVTGAGGGIGAETAKLFARCGAKLALVDRCQDILDEVLEDCQSDGAEVVAIPADMSNEEKVQCVADETLDKFKEVDVLVNAHGIMERGTIEDTNMKQYDKIMNVNTRGIYQLIMLLAPTLISNRGNIVNVSSVCGIRSFPNILAYNMSKSALDQLTRCVALELGAQGVRCNSVNPGVIVTGLHLAGGYSEDEYTDFLEKAQETHALGRAGQPEEVAYAICFLASHMASFITGVNLAVDGGKHVMCPR